MLGFWCHQVTPTRMSTEFPKEYEYNLAVRTNDVRAAIAQTAGALYELVEEALQQHEDHEAEECEFELFARDLLGLLARHSEQITNSESSLTDGFHEVDPEGVEVQ